MTSAPFYIDGGQATNDTPLMALRLQWLLKSSRPQGMGVPNTASDKAVEPSVIVIPELFNRVVHFLT